MKAMKKQDKRIHAITLVDTYKEAKTFHVTYLDRTKNLTTEEVGSIRKTLIASLQKEFGVKIK